MNEKEELYDKYLNDTLSADELNQFEQLMMDEENGRDFVAYCVEIRDYVHMAEKVNSKKNIVKKKKPKIKKKTGKQATNSLRNRLKNKKQ